MQIPLPLRHGRAARRHLALVVASCLAAILVLLAMVGLGWWFLPMAAGCAICLLPALPAVLREAGAAGRRWPGRIPRCGLRR